MSVYESANKRVFVFLCQYEYRLGFYFSMFKSCFVFNHYSISSFYCSLRMRDQVLSAAIFLSEVRVKHLTLLAMLLSSLVTLDQQP